VIYGTSMALAAPLVGTMLTVPAYLVAMGGLFVRSLTEKTDNVIPASVAN
jgi:hypothetical protein